MKKEEVAYLTKMLKDFDALEPHENLLSWMLRQLNSEGNNISTVAHHLNITRFKVVRYLEANGFKRVVRWMNV